MLRDADPNYFKGIYIVCGYTKEGKTLLFASHNREDIEVLCDEVYEMDKGKLAKIR